jgi:hypothetical protein
MSFSDIYNGAKKASKDIYKFGKNIYHGGKDIAVDYTN